MVDPFGRAGGVAGAGREGRPELYNLYARFSTFAPRVFIKAALVEQLGYSAANVEKYIESKLIYEDFRVAVSTNDIIETKEADLKEFARRAGIFIHTQIKGTDGQPQPQPLP